MTALAIIPLNEIERMAGAFAKAGLFGMKTADQAIALMLVAQAEGQHPATIAQDYDIIQGRAARKTHSVLARFQAAGGKVEWQSLSDTEAVAVFSHPQGGSLRMCWTIDQARKAGLTNKDNWKNYPRAMLRARCIAEGVRAVYPGAIGGLLVAEEAQDLPREPAKSMGAADVVRPELPPELLAKAREAADKGLAAYGQWWTAISKAERVLLAGEHDSLKLRAGDADRARTVEAEPLTEEQAAFAAELEGEAK
jgi:hypothetical protein